MAAPEQFWKEVYDRFNPESTPENRAWWVSRPYGPAQRILESLRGGLAQPRVLLFGTRGTGKTTELFQVADGIGPDRLAVYLDIHHHLEERVRDGAAIDLLKAWEVLYFVGLAALRVGVESVGAAPLVEEAKRLGEAIRHLHLRDGEAAPEVDAMRLAGQMLVGTGGLLGGAAGVGLQMLGAAAGASSWRIRVGRRTEAHDDQDERVWRLLEAVNAVIDATARGGRRLVLLLDGLDRISREQTADEIFVQSGLLSRLRFDAMVAVGPVSLRRQGKLGTVRGFRTEIVHEVPVLDFDDPRRDGRGVDFFVELWGRRTQDLTGGACPDDILRRAARFSGGRTRSFQRIVRDLAEAAYAARSPTVDRAWLDTVLNGMRLELEEGITRADLALLRQVMDDPRRLPDERDRYTDLLERFLLYPYPNQSTWYYPNPLLMLGPLLGPSASGASST